MSFLRNLFVPKTKNSQINALLGFMHNETLVQLAQGVKEKIARLTALATGQISREQAEIARQDLMLQAAQAKHAAKTADGAAAIAEAEAKLANLNALISLADGILKQEL